MQNNPTPPGAKTAIENLQLFTTVAVAATETLDRDQVRAAVSDVQAIARETRTQGSRCDELNSYLTRFATEIDAVLEKDNDIYCLLPSEKRR